MKALLIVSHGSRRQASNDEIRQLTEMVKKLVSQDFLIVESAFLELAEPLIPVAINNCIACGATSIIVVPYFLAAGTHVANDIPSIIEQARSENPSIEITLKPHIGGVPSMANLIVDMVSI